MRPGASFIYPRIWRGTTGAAPSLHGHPWVYREERHKRINSFKLVPLAMTAVAFAIAAPASAPAGDLDGQSIKVCTWGGSWRDIQRDNDALLQSMESGTVGHKGLCR